MKGPYLFPDTEGEMRTVEADPQVKRIDVPLLSVQIEGPAFRRRLLGGKHARSLKERAIV